MEVGLELVGSAQRSEVRSELGRLDFCCNELEPRLRSSMHKVVNTPHWQHMLSAHRFRTCATDTMVVVSMLIIFRNVKTVLINLLCFNVRVCIFANLYSCFHNSVYTIKKLKVEKVAIRKKS